MNAIRRTIVLIGSLSLAMATLLALGPAAFAKRHPLPEEMPGPAPHGVPVVGQDRAPIVTHHGSPLWTFVVVAVVAIGVTLAVQLLLAKVRPALRRRLAHA